MMKNQAEPATNTRPMTEAVPIRMCLSLILRMSLPIGARAAGQRIGSGITDQCGDIKARNRPATGRFDVKLSPYSLGLHLRLRRPAAAVVSVEERPRKTAALSRSRRSEPLG